MAKAKFFHNIFMTGFVITIVSGIFLFPAFNDENSTAQNKFPGNYNIMSVPLPDSLEFAGEEIPLHYKDVYESLDKELLINTYWQSQTLLFMKRANKYFPQIEEILAEEGVPDDIKYLTLTESGLEHVVSPSGATGFWQLLEGTAKDYGLEVNSLVDERYHLEKSTRVACRFLKDSYEKYSDWTMAIASYNMGRRGLDRQIAQQKQDNYFDILLNSETARYVYRTLAFKLICTNPESFGFHVNNKHYYEPVNYYEVTVDTSISDITKFALELGTNYKILKILNPWIRDNYLLNKNKTYTIKIPTETGREFSN